MLIVGWAVFRECIFGEIENKNPVFLKKPKPVQTGFNGSSC